MRMGPYMFNNSFLVRVHMPRVYQYTVSSGNTSQLDEGENYNTEIIKLSHYCLPLKSMFVMMYAITWNVY